MSGQYAAGMPSIKLAHLSRVGWHARYESSADVPHEHERRRSWSPESQYQCTGVIGIAEAVPLPARRGNHRAGTCFPLLVANHAQLAVEHVDRLVEALMNMRDRTSEMGRDGDLHGREPGGLAIMSGQDVDRLASVKETGARAGADQERHDPFYQLSARGPAAASLLGPAGPTFASGSTIGWHRRVKVCDGSHGAGNRS